MGTSKICSALSMVPGKYPSFDVGDEAFTIQLSFTFFVFFEEVRFGRVDDDDDVTNAAAAAVNDADDDADGILLSSFLSFRVCACSLLQKFSFFFAFFFLSFFRYFLTPIAMHGAIIIKYM
jgi:hypothetical protein